jgi:trigger factor
MLTRIKENLQEQLQRDADSSYQGRVIDQMVKGATIEYPRILVEHEIDHIIRESMGGDTQAYAAYLQRVGRSEAEYRESLGEVAELRVKRALVLSHIAEAEGIEVGEDEIEAEIDTLAGPMGEDSARFKEMFSSGEGSATIRRSLINRKLLERVAAIAADELKEEPA